LTNRSGSATLPRRWANFISDSPPFSYLEIVEERIAENPPQVGKLHVLLLETGLVPVALLLQLLDLAVRVARLRAQLLIFGVQLLCFKQRRLLETSCTSNQFC
jgi:hypothetical protein